MRQAARRRPLVGKASRGESPLPAVDAAVPLLRDHLQSMFQRGQDQMTYGPLQAACRTALGEAHHRGLIVPSDHPAALDQLSALLASMVVFRYIAGKRPWRVSGETGTRQYFLIDVLWTLDELLER